MPFRLAAPLRKGLWVGGIGAYALELCIGRRVDWIAFDLQHGDVRLADLPGLMRVAEAAAVPAFVRTASHSAREILAAIDAGADGVIIPAVESAAQAEALVRAVCLPPLGSRSTGTSRRLTSALHVEPPILLPMVETAAGASSLEAIASVAGVDGIFIGPYDLSRSLGISSVDSSEGIAAVSDLLSRIAATGKLAGLMAGSTALRTLAPQAEFVAVATDLSALAAGIDQLVGPS